MNPVKEGSDLAALLTISHSRNPKQKENIVKTVVKCVTKWMFVGTIAFLLCGLVGSPNTAAAQNGWNAVCTGTVFKLYRRETTFVSRSSRESIFQY
jgi:hypothetical protein